jgi:hypothetical protein
MLINWSFSVFERVFPFNFEINKSVALVERMNTYIILHTKEFKIAFKIQNL